MCNHDQNFEEFWDTIKRPSRRIDRVGKGVETNNRT